MPLELYLAFVAATAVLILIPGPAVAPGARYSRRAWPPRSR